MTPVSHPGVLCGEVCRHGRRLVGGMVVEDEDADVDPLLCEDTGHAIV
jgi:hypothetical protein